MWRSSRSALSRGFAAYLQQTIDLLPGLVTIDWLLVAYNASAWTAPLLLGLKDVGSEGVFAKILEDIKDGQPLAGQGRSAGWGFGLGRKILDGTIRAKLLWVDGGSSGLMIASELLRDALGFELGFAVGYLKGERPEDDRFWTEFPIPMMDFGPFVFLGGVIGLEYFVRGGFTFDAGFPWLENGIRRWDRGFGVNYLIFVGHAGVYLKYLPGTRPAPGGGTSCALTVAAGFGLAVGYGFCKTYADVFTVYLSIEVYAIVEGVVVVEFESPIPTRIRHSGRIRLSGSFG